MKNEFFACQCFSDEHTLRFVYDDYDPELFVSVFLRQHRNIFQRFWVAIKYVFGYTCKYGHWDCFTLRREDGPRLVELVNKFMTDFDKEEEARDEKAKEIHGETMESVAQIKSTTI